METLKPLHINDLGDELLDILLTITALRDRSNRDILLHNWPADAPVMAINRSNAPMTDLSYIIDTIASWGRLKTGEWALAILAKKTLLLTKGTELERRLKNWLSQLDTLTPDDHYQQPPLGDWSKQIPRIIRQGWPVWLTAIAGLGFISPILWPTAIVFNEITRYIAAGLVITLTLSIIGIRLELIILPFKWWVRSVTISIYGPMMGFVLGVANSLLWLRSFYFIYTDQQASCLREWSLGEAELVDYLSLLIASLVLSLVVALIVFLALPGFGKFFSTLNRKYISGILVGYLLLTGLLLLLGTILPYGWLAAIGLQETPILCSP